LIAGREQACSSDPQDRHPSLPVRGPVTPPAVLLWCHVNMANGNLGNLGHVGHVGNRQMHLFRE
jgi:hypothetical protein